MTNSVQSHTDTSRLAKVLTFLESGGTITTGVHGNEGGSEHSPAGPSIADIASWAEFGVGQPQRSWLRAWFDENGDRIQAMLAKQFQLAMAKGQTFEWAAERVALWLQADIQRRIRNRIDPPNADSTIKRKGSSTPLIDTGVFRSAILSYYEGKTVAAAATPGKNPNKPRRSPRKKGKAKASVIDQRPFLSLAGARLVLARSVARCLVGLTVAGETPVWDLEVDGKPALVTWEDEPSQNCDAWARLTLVSMVDEGEPSERIDPDTKLVTVRTTKRAQVQIMAETTEAQIAADMIAQVALRIYSRNERDRLAVAGLVVIEKPTPSQGFSYDDREQRDRVSVVVCEVAIRFITEWTDTSVTHKPAKSVQVSGTAGGVPVNVTSPPYVPAP